MEVPLVSECTIIKGLPLAYTRYAAVSVDGPVRLGLLVYPDVVTVGWWWHGKRYNAVIRRQKSRAGRYWLVCPRCAKRKLRIYVLPPDKCRCRMCLKLQYETHPNSRAREPKRLRAWLKWFDRRFANAKDDYKRLAFPAKPGSPAD